MIFTPFYFVAYLKGRYCSANCSLFTYKKQKYIPEDLELSVQYRKKYIINKLAINILLSFFFTVEQIYLFNSNLATPVSC